MKAQKGNKAHANSLNSKQKVKVVKEPTKGFAEAEEGKGENGDAQGAGDAGEKGTEEGNSEDGGAAEGGDANQGGGDNTEDGGAAEGGDGDKGAGDTESGGDSSAFQDEGLAAHNAFRKVHGTAPLKLDPGMSKEAEAYAQLIAKEGKLFHSSSKDGENLAMGCNNRNVEVSAGEAVKDWYVILSQL